MTDPVPIPRPDPEALPGRRYFLGRFHEKRFAPQGYIREARVALRSRIRPGPAKQVKFLIFCRARSGSTLLADLLEQLPGVHAERELLATGRLRPRGFARDVERGAPEHHFGFKLLSYQMVEVQALRDPEAFLRGCIADGYQIIHLTRDTLDQAISIATASQSGRFHRDLAQPSVEAAPPGDPIVLDVPNFMNRLRWNIQLLEFEQALMARLPHIAVSYEADLADASRHQATADRLAASLGIPPGPVTAHHQKILARSLDRVAANAEEIRTAVHAAGLSHVLGEERAHAARD